MCGIFLSIKFSHAHVSIEKEADFATMATELEKMNADRGNAMSRFDPIALVVDLLYHRSRRAELPLLIISRCLFRPGGQ